jgi:hypothetical protein
MEQNFVSRTSLLVASILIAAGAYAVGYRAGEGSLSGHGAAPAVDAHAGHVMDHPMAPADPALPLPSATISATPDSKGGYNVRVAVENFRFTPEKAGQAAEQGAGHAHLFVDGVKVGRLYGEWAYLGSEHFPGNGPHEISVTLNANDHAEWTLPSGEHVGAAVSTGN